MELISTEFSATGIQLTYTDGLGVQEASEALVVRLPLQGSFNRSLNWHQVNTIERAIAALTELRTKAVRQLEKGD